jgi:hypothetical protein
LANNRPWTAAELQTIEAMRGRHTHREIAETLGRSTVSVKNKMKPSRLNTGTKSTTPANTARASLAERLGAGKDAQPARPVMRREPAELEPILIVSDAHRPYHSKVWWDLLMQVGRFLQPKHLIVIGDFADFYAVSSHDKDPQRATRLEEELADVDQGLDDLDSLGASNKLFIEGNHEDRLRRLLMQTPSLAGLVSTEKLLKLRERGWHFTPYKRHTALGALHYTHDVGASGRNAAFRVLDTYQHSAVSGHAHRMQYIVEGNAVGDVKLSAMFGWGGDVNAVDYMHIAKARKDWCLGFGCGYYDPSSGYSYLVPVPVVDATVCVNGRLFRSAA